MSYVALYRKFRPGTFAQVIGQEHVVRALKNQLINERIGHAYLFTGTRGTGKTSAAKIFAKAVNCLDLKNGEPCNECENCRSINAGNFVDVVEVDAASNNGVDDIRQIIEEVRYTPVKGKYKVFIIDEAHMITGAAFNAFLKTLEEPPAYAVFILATTEPHKLPVTILSRVQRYDFKRIPSQQITDGLAQIVQKEGVQAQEKALRYIARIGDGSMRDSVSLLDKCIAFNLGQDLTYENVLDTLGTVDTEVFSRLFRSIYSSDAAGALKVLDSAAEDGRDLSQFATDFIWYIRNLLMAGASDAADMEMLGVSEENMALIKEDAHNVQPDVLMRYIRILSETIDAMRFSTSKQILLEVALIKLAKPQMETDVSSLADRIRQLEMRSAVPAQAAPKPQAFNAPAQQAGPERQEDTYESAFPEEDYYAMNRPKMTNPDALAMLLDDVPVQGAPKSPGPKPQAAPANKTAEAKPQSGQDFRQTWQTILGSCTSRMIKTTLNKCAYQFTEDGVLDIYAPSDFLQRQLKDEQVMSELCSLVKAAAGKDIQIRVLKGTAPESTNANMQNNPVRNTGAADSSSVFPEELLNNINFNIGTEEY